MPNSTNNPPRIHMLKRGKAKMMLHALCGRFWVKDEGTHQSVTAAKREDVTCRRCQIKYDRGER